MLRVFLNMVNMTFLKCLLKRLLSFNLSKRPSAADLGSARGEWSGNITGEFKIIRDPRDGLFRKSSEQNNPPVNEVRRSGVERNPIVNFTIERRDFRDDPEGGNGLT